MAVTKREYIFASFLLSAVSMALLVGAFATDSWIVGETLTDRSEHSLLNYGLFTGKYINKDFSTPKVNSLYVTCLLGDNVCAVSCKPTAEARKKELTYVLNNQLPEINCESADDDSVSGTITTDILWFNGGVYVSSILFLALALLLAAVCAVLGVYNTARSPVEPLLGIHGVYIWTWVAGACDLLVLMLWGIHFATNSEKNLSFIHIMVNELALAESSLGFSYWLVFASLICHCLSGAALEVRNFLIKRDPIQVIENIDTNTDDTIFLY